MLNQKDLRVVIVGSGRTGLQTARMLADRGHDVVVIERNFERVRNLVDEHVAAVIEGDATNSEILREADLQRADVIVSMTDTMGTNFTVCTLAAELNPDIRTVMRSVYEETDYAKFVDEIVFPERAGARATINTVEQDIRSYEESLAQVEAFEIPIAPGAPVAGKALAEVSLLRGSTYCGDTAPVAGRPLADISLRCGSLVVSDDDGNSIAGSQTTLEPGRTYIVAVEPDVTDEVLNLFQGAGG